MLLSASTLFLRARTKFRLFHKPSSADVLVTIQSLHEAGKKGRNKVSLSLQLDGEFCKK